MSGGQTHHSTCDEQNMCSDISGRYLLMINEKKKKRDIFYFKSDIVNCRAPLHTSPPVGA